MRTSSRQLAAATSLCQMRLMHTPHLGLMALAPGVDFRAPMALQALAEAVWAIPTSQLAWGMIAAAVVTFFMLLFGPVAPYGRQAPSQRPRQAAPPAAAARHVELAPRCLQVLEGRLGLPHQPQAGVGRKSLSLSVSGCLSGIPSPDRRGAAPHPTLPPAAGSPGPTPDTGDVELPGAGRLAGLLRHPRAVGACGRARQRVAHGHVPPALLPPRLHLPAAVGVLGGGMGVWRAAARLAGRGTELARGSQDGLAPQRPTPAPPRRSLPQAAWQQAHAVCGLAHGLRVLRVQRLHAGEAGGAPGRACGSLL